MGAPSDASGVPPAAHCLKGPAPLCPAKAPSPPNPAPVVHLALDRKGPKHPYATRPHDSQGRFGGDKTSSSKPTTLNLASVYLCLCLPLHPLLAHLAIGRVVASLERREPIQPEPSLQLRQPPETLARTPNSHSHSTHSMPTGWPREIHNRAHVRIYGDVYPSQSAA